MEDVDWPKQSCCHRLKSAKERNKRKVSTDVNGTKDGRIYIPASPDGDCHMTGKVLSQDFPELAKGVTSSLRHKDEGSMQRRGHFM